MINDISFCKVIELPLQHIRSGNLTSIQNETLLPFNIKRVYYLYDVPGGSERGGHAHKTLFQLIIAASGSFEVVINDGTKRKVVLLNRPYKGLLIVPGIWREIINFSSGGICLVLASEKYDENDYIRNFNNFLDFKDGFNRRKKSTE